MDTLKQLGQVLCLATILALLVGCSSSSSAPELSANTPIPAGTAAPIQPIPTIPVSISFPLSEPGLYFAGNTAYKLVDQSRNGREINVTIWYPAVEQADAPGKRRDAPPDMSGAPYPLILTEPNSGDLLFSHHLASHGFAMVIVRFPDKYDKWDLGVVEHPRDMLFALDQIASNPPAGLEGVIDTDHAGVTGYSSGGFISLAVSGVRIDPGAYLEYCKQAPTIQPALEAWYIEYTCSLADKWDELAEIAGEEITASEDGLWQALSDQRIRAVAPLAPEGAWLYGERGLAQVDRPVFMVAPSEEEFTLEIEINFISEHLGSQERSLV